LLQIASLNKYKEILTKIDSEATQKLESGLPVGPQVGARTHTVWNYSEAYVTFFYRFNGCLNFWSVLRAYFDCLTEI